MALTDLTRRELYDLVWAQPMKTLAATFSLSDVGLKKKCAKLEIPMPERGYWAKVQAGKAVVQTPLPPRGPGMPDTVDGDRHYWGYTTDPVAILAEPVLEKPVFDEPIDAVRDRVAKRLGKVAAARPLTSPHPAIQVLIEKDEKLRQARAADRYAYSWNTPLFDSGFEQRRLRVLNALFLGLAKLECRAAFTDKPARGISIKVGGQSVDITLDHSSAKKTRHGEWETRPGKADLMVLTLEGPWDRPAVQTWTEEGDQKLDDQLTEIALAIIVQGELNFRRGAERSYEWKLERRQRADEELAKRRAEAQRKAREEKIRLEKEARDELLRQVRDFDAAVSIRRYVSAVQARLSGGEPEAVEAWAAHAHAVADQTDPLLKLTICDGRVQRGDEAPSSEG